MIALTYAWLLLIFIAIPVAALAGFVAWDAAHAGGAGERRWRPVLVTLVVLIALATLYTFPWDDHLIALGVWGYRPALIAGVFVGHVPLEELLFFPLQTLFAGLWLMWLAPRAAQLEYGAGAAHGGLGQLITVALGAFIWLAALALLIAGWERTTYLGWEVTWALPPLGLQTLVGGDMLWRRRWLILVGVVPLTLYLCCVDALAVHSGIWTIDPRHSLNILVGGVLPIEEVIFFLLTTTLIVCGVALGLSEEVSSRVARLFAHLGRLSPAQARS